MKRVCTLIIIGTLCLSLAGCGWFDGSYVSVKPHWEPKQDIQSDTLSASDYLGLIDAMGEMIAKGTEEAPIVVADYRSGAVEAGMDIAVEYLMKTDPLGAYALEGVEYELGTSGGLPALAVKLSYSHTRAQIQRIRTVADIAAARQVLADALDSFATEMVVYVESYEPTDFIQAVQDYAAQYPQRVMETPQVTEVLYGSGSGRGRVVELQFSYQTSRDSLRQMKRQIQPVFDAASLYVSGSGSQRQKFSQLFGFLMERFDYTYETSLTPAYSLLSHGVGDSRAFATVYAAMCRGADLECRTVTGTCDGEPRTWNIIVDNGQYFHVDLLKSHESGQLKLSRDWEMTGYVWDYSSYPACVGAAAEEEPTEASTAPETTAEPTE
ncbi:MAG: transglutaminase domain-containing protein [Eubacteriales bacterium]|nr:transglutaminase domain-containing protein [Eubacteriales bacterium]